MTIRLRLTLLYSTLLMAIIVVFGVAVYGLLYRTLRTQVDNNLLHVLDEIEGDVYAVVDERCRVHYSPSPEMLDAFRSPGIYVQLSLKGEKYPLNLTQSLGTHHSPLDSRMLYTHDERLTNVTIDDTNLRVLTRPIIVNGCLAGHLQAASSVDTIDQASDRLLRIMLSGGAIALILSFVLGNWLASNALRPISKITETAQAIVAADDLGRRVPYEGTQDELGSLIITINKMLERLEKLFNTQRRFVADISHELRTPVTAIQGHAELMQRFGHDPQSLEVIKIETQRMARLVGDLLLLAQADIGKLPLLKMPVELDTLMLNSYNEAQLLSKGRVQVELGKIDHLIVEGDPDRLKQLMSNLITNALKYTNDGGKVSLTMRRRGKWAEISVADTGLGIPEEDLPHIFERFYRVDTARSRDAGGSGLGLSIALWIAEAHGGKLRVESTLGEGSTFILCLPTGN